MGCLFPGVRDTRLGRVLGLCASLIWSMPMHLAARYFTPFADPENHALRQVVLSVWVRTRHGCEEQQIQNSGLEHNSVKRWLKRGLQNLSGPRAIRNSGLEMGVTATASGLPQSQEALGLKATLR